MTEYVTAKNLARLIGLDKRSVLYHIERGNLPARMIGCQFLITAQDAMTFAEKYSAGSFKNAGSAKRWGKR